MQTPIREIMATTSKDTSIRIKESTRFRLDMLKGNKSHDAFVAEMLLYFETTGITPPVSYTHLTRPKSRQAG